MTLPEGTELQTGALSYPEVAQRNTTKI